MTRRRIAPTAFAAVAFALTSAVAWAANPAALDSSFSGDGKQTLDFGFAAKSDQANGVVALPSGKIVAVGYATQAGSNDSFAVARLNPNGEPDPDFSGDGRRVVDFSAVHDYGTAVTAQPDGRIVVAGYVQNGTNDYEFGVTRLTSGGQLDSTFSQDGKQMTDFSSGGDDDEAYAVAIQADGRIVVAGYSDTGAGNKFAIARYMPNGSLDDSFSGDGKRLLGFPPGGDDEAFGLAIQADGRIVIVGESARAPGDFDFALARLLPGGGIDSSFSGDGRRLVSFAGSDIPRGVGVAGSRIVAAGESRRGANAYDFAVAALHPDGTLDPGWSQDGKRLDSFGSASGDRGNAVAIQPNGKVIVAGTASEPTDTHFALIRYRSNGTRDPTFAGDGVRFTDFADGPYDGAKAVDLDENGRIVLAGYAHTGSYTKFAFARYLGGP
jgi:uncharacterized delta-60 repeat protein